MTTDATEINFNQYARNVHSQYGEDGIISEIISRIDATRPPGDRYCVEFGAWDGIYLSNTYNLVNSHGYHAVLIEADHKKYKALCENIPLASVIKIRELVGFEGEMTLDSILQRAELPIRFDVLSIDIDGNDYHILQSIKKYRPIIICIEYNPTIPNAVIYIQDRDFRVKRGASAAAIAALGSSMGYATVAATKTNLILLDRDYLGAVGLVREPTLQEVREDNETINYVFCGYDGAVLTSSPVGINWHGIAASDRVMQTLPAYLRTFPDDYGPMQRLLFRAFKIWHKLRSKA